MRYDLGYFNLEQKTPQQPENGPARSDRAGPRVKGLSYKCSRVSIPARTGICEIGSWPQTNFLVTFESPARLRRSGVLLRNNANGGAFFWRGGWGGMATQQPNPLDPALTLG